MNSSDEDEFQEERTGGLSIKCIRCKEKPRRPISYPAEAWNRFIRKSPSSSSLFESSSSITQPPDLIRELLQLKAMKISKTESDLESLQKTSKLRDNNKQTFSHNNQLNHSLQQAHKISKTKSNPKKDCITRSCISQ